MALASQTSGPVRRNRYMYRRRQTHPSRWIGLLVLLVIVGVIVWLALPESGSSDTTTEPAPELVVQAQTPGATLSSQEPIRTATETPPAVTPAPVSEPAPTQPPVEEPTSAPVKVAGAHTEDPQINTESSSFVVPIPPSLAVTTRSSVNSPSAEVADAIRLAPTDPVTARAQLSELLTTGKLSPADRNRVRAELTKLGNILFFDKQLYPNDPFARSYTIQNGDSLERIAKRENVSADWRMIQRVNGISNPNKIRAGGRLKIPVGTFHAVIFKKEFLLELYLQNDKSRILVATYPVGLGEFDATPLGRFDIKPNSRLVNPQWTNPRTGQFFPSDDPKNPIGERWMGLRGIDPGNTGMLGYGIHGTIDPNSIGQMQSMGCVRMRDADVHVVYEALTERGSTVEIRE